jgi:hypothetical protein
MTSPPDEITFTLQPSPMRRRSGNRTTSSLPLGPALPRISRLMALAIKLDGMLADHADLDCKELARVGNISRTRLTQILNLLQLAPDIQERLLWLPAAVKGRDPITEKQIRKLCGLYAWERQRQAFERLFGPRIVS